jgi:hypothetical protein
VNASPDVVATSLYEVVVVERAEDDLPEQFEVPAVIVPLFRARVTLYREAIILMSLVSESQTKRQFKDVLIAYEILLMGSVPSPAALQKMNELKAAMADLNRLYNPEGLPKEFTWGMEWFQEIGHNEVNPVRLCLFAALWMGEFVSTVQTLRDLESTG